MARDYLFSSSNLDDRLRLGHQGASEAVQAIPEAQFLASSDEEIIDHIRPTWTLVPLVLQEDAARMEQQETQVDVSRDPNRLLFPEDRNRPHFVQGTEVTIRTPYTGTTWLWDAKTNPFAHIFPVGLSGKAAMQLVRSRKRSRSHTTCRRSGSNSFMTKT